MSINNLEFSQLMLASPQPRRFLLAFLLAPLAGPLGISVGMSGPVLFDNPNPLMLVVIVPFVYVLATPIVYFFSLVLGLPFVLLLHLTLGLSRLGLIIGWAVVGMLSFFCFSGFNIPDKTEEILFYLPFAVGGAAVGFTFWGILCAKPGSMQRQAERERRHEMAHISREKW